MATIKRIGVLTGGGDCPRLNAVIRAVTKTAINEYGVEVVGFRDGFKGLVENDYVPLDLRAVSGIAHLGGTILGTTNRDNPFNFHRVINGQDHFSDRSQEAIANMEKLGLGD